MATVIRIDPDDELPAILERLPRGAPCVIVLPPHARALNGPVGAKLLSRRATALGSRVAVVTDEHPVIAHATAAGVPVAPTVDEAQRLLANGSTDRDTQDTLDYRLPPSGGDDEGEADHAADAGNGPTPAAVFTAGALHAHPDDEPPEVAPGGPATGTAGAGSATTSSAATAATAIRGHSGGHRAAPAGAAGGGRAPSAAAPASRPQAAARARRGLAGWIVPAALLILPLLLLLWLADYVLTGLLNPSATVIVHPRAGAVIGSANVVAILNLPAAQRTEDRIAMARADQREQYTIALPVHGVKLLPGHVATGRLLLGNLTSRPLVVPAGTTFTTARNGVAFVSTRAITLPAAVETFAVVRYGTGVVPIRAAVGGKAGNVPARAIVNVPASFTGALKVENDAPTAGGTDVPERVVAPHDLTVAAARLFGILEQEAHHDIARLHNWDVEQQTLYVARSPVVPHLAPDRRSATLTLSLVVHAVYVHKSDLRPAAIASLQPALHMLPHTTLIASSVGWTPTWQPDGPNRQFISLAVTGRTSTPLNVADLRRAISGRTRAAAQAYLVHRSDVVSAHIELSPLWADRLPDDVTRIQITVGEAQ